MIQKADTGNNKTFFFFRYLGCPYLYIIPVIITITLPWSRGWSGAVWGTWAPFLLSRPHKTKIETPNECEL